jgi:hypothetical protein
LGNKKATVWHSRLIAGAQGVAFSCEIVRLDEAESASGPQNAAHYSDFLQGIKKR